MSDYEFVRPIFVTDTNGDVWKKIGDGYIHRMYGLFWDGDPNNTPNNLKKRIAYENAKRATKYNKHNWRYIQMLYSEQYKIRLTQRFSY